MTMWARVQDGIAVELTDVDPEGRFHPSLIWVLCNAQVRPGWVFQGGYFSEPMPSFDELAGVERDWRDRQLASLQWLRDRHRDEQDMGRPTTFNAEQFGSLLAYMQLLREWPQSVQFPDSSKRPVIPAWLAEVIQ